MIDVDHFKRFNDTYGHPTGDSVLRAMADLFHDSIRKTDLAARYGGEEFVILLRFAPHQEALDIAENIRAKMEVMDFVPEGSEKNVQLTVSIGVATWPEHATKPLELLEKADGALYQSKGAGRNIVTSANGTDQNGDAL